MQHALEFGRAYAGALSRLARRTLAAVKGEVMREFNVAWTARSAAIYRERSGALLDFADQRLNVGPNGAAWMTPDELVFFRHFNPIYWRAVNKVATEASEQDAPVLRRASRALATGAATTAARRKRTAAKKPGSRRNKTG